MFAIYKKELKSYFTSFIGWLFIGVMLFFLGLYFTVFGLMYGYPNYSYVVSNIAFWYLISTPILTMRCLAEERKNKTDQLILTAPVTVGKIVLGKFLALITILAIPMGVACVHPLILTWYGSVPLGECYVAILGFFLYGVVSIAVGVLVSALTESQVIAAVLGFGLLFVGYMMDGICDLISSTGNLLTRILGYFDLCTPFYNLLNGTLNVDSVVYYLSMTAVLLFLTVQVIQKRRYSVSVKQISLSAYNTGMIAVVVAIAAFVNVIVSEMPASWTALDLTSQKLYSVTDQTKEFVKSITEDVDIYVIVAEENCDTTVKQTLQHYDDLSDHVKVEYIDPVVNPRFHTQYTDSGVTTNSLIVVSDNRSKVISYNDLYESTVDYETYTSTVTGYDAEGQITSALNYVLSDDMPKLYITEGHNEYSLSSTFTDGLKKQSVDYEVINLMDYESVPEDASCLLINAPSTDFNSDDKDKIMEYLDKGGNVVAITAYTDAKLSNYHAILAHMGITIVDGMVIDQNSGNYYQIPYYLLPTVEYSSYTTGVYGNYYVFAPFAQGIVTDENAENITFSTFLSTSDSAFSKISLTQNSDMKKEEGDIDGPFGIGVEAVKRLTGSEENVDTEATMIVVSCEQLFTDDADYMVSGANQIIFNNIMGSFSEYEVNVSIPVKDYTYSYLMVTQRTIFSLGALVTIVIPVGCLAAGFVIWFRRRKR